MPGQTVVLKTAGLFRSRNRFRSGGAGTRLLSRRSRQIGDAGDPRRPPTFPSSMETWRRSSGSRVPARSRGDDRRSDDPQEGALGVAWLESYLERGGRDRHDPPLRDQGLRRSRPDALCAAMSSTRRRRPTYRLHPANPGAATPSRSRERDPRGRARPRARLWETWRRRSVAETGPSRRSSACAGEAGRGRRRVERGRAAPGGPRGPRRSARASSRRGRRDRTGAHRARAGSGARASRLRQDTPGSPGPTAGLIEAAETERRPPSRCSGRAREARGRGRGSGWRARARGPHGGKGPLSREIPLGTSAADALPRESLEPLDSPPPPAARVEPFRPAGPSASAGAAEVRVIGQRLEEAIDEVERALDRAILAGDSRLRVVHGHGTGRLRDGLRAHLRGHPAVASIRPADPREGGNGATIVELK